MAGYKCPFCSAVIAKRADFHSSVLLDEKEYNDVENADDFDRFKTQYLSITVVTCPECEKYFVVADGRNGFCENKHFNIYPSGICTKFPEYVPQAIREDFEEAHSIKDLSPKAAATLARRCLQGIIRDFWGIQKSNLKAAIEEIQDKIPPLEWNAIDSLRKIGNIGAHMESDVNLIIDIDPNEAEMLLKLIKHLINSWYVEKYETEKLLEDIQSVSVEKTIAKSPY